MARANNAITMERFEFLAKMSATTPCKDVAKQYGVGKGTVTKARRMFPQLAHLEAEPATPFIPIRVPEQSMVVHAAGDPECVHHLIAIDTDWPRRQDIFRCLHCGRLVGYPRQIQSKQFA